MIKLLNLFTLTSLIIMASCGGAKKETSQEETTKKVSVTNEEATKEAAKEDAQAVAKPDMNIAEVKMLAQKWEMKSYTHKDGKKEENLKDRFLNLKPDGGFEELFGAKKIAAGFWQLSENKKELVLIHKEGELAMQLKGGREVLDIKELKADKLITADDKDDDGKVEMTEEYVPAK